MVTKVGGFIAIPNSTLEDSDIALANEILDGMGQGIGLAIDKAILYGTGTKMPVGIVKRFWQKLQNQLTTAAQKRGPT